MIRRYHISNGLLSAHILNLGAIVQDLRLSSIPHSLVLGYDTIDDYKTNANYFGAIVGRCANRTRSGLLSLGQQTWQLDLNEQDRTHLHGGANGFSNRVWTVDEHHPDRIELSLHSAHGDMGYPGNLTVRCHISIQAPASLVFKLYAETDQLTVCNLAHHSYFNLDGADSIGNHHLRVSADHYLTIDAEFVPTGEIASVDSTNLDYRELTPVRMAFHHDHNYCLYGKPRALTHVADVVTPNVSMSLHTTEPGLQFYDGAGVSVPRSGLDGRVYGSRAGLCLEPQRWPDSIHHPHFAGALLAPDERYVQHTEYRFA